METNTQIVELLNQYLPTHELLHCEDEDHDILDFKFKIAGVALKLENGLEVFGSSSAEKSSPLRYAAYECLERFVLLNSAKPQDESLPYKFSLSNGVALHDNFEKASQSALAELVERNEILKSWYYNSPIELLPFDASVSFSQEMSEKYDFFLASFSQIPSHFVTGLFAFPKVSGVNLIYGFGSSAEGLEIATQKAKKEFTTRLGFIWGESAELTAHDRKSGLYHQDYYLMPENLHHLKEWLTGSKYAKKSSTRFLLEKPEFTDLTPLPWRASLAMAKAHCQDSIPLFFGEPPLELFDFSHRCDIPHPII